MRSLYAPNPLGLGKQAFGLLKNLLALEGAEGNGWQGRMVELTLTSCEDWSPHEAGRALRGLTGWLRGRVVHYAYVCGRTRAGRLHWHFFLLVAEPHGGRSLEGQRRLVDLRRAIRAEAFRRGFGTQLRVRPVKSLAGYAIYMARHVDVPRGQEDKGMRRVAYSQGFPRVFRGGFSWATPWARRWRRAIALVAMRYGHRHEDRDWGWIGRHREHLRRVAAGLPLPAPVGGPTVWWRGVDWRGQPEGPWRRWEVRLLPETVGYERGPLFYLRRPTEGTERYLTGDPEGRQGVQFPTYLRDVAMADLRRIRHAEPPLVADFQPLPDFC